MKMKKNACFGVFYRIIDGLSRLCHGILRLGIGLDSMFWSLWGEAETTGSAEGGHRGAFIVKKPPFLTNLSIRLGNGIN